MIAINRCIYNGYSSEDFDLLCDVAFDSDNGDMSSFLTREAIASESYLGDYKRVHTYKYNEVFSPVITFIKKDFRDFTFEEQRKVLRWLTSKRTASFLTVYYDDSEVITYEILGGFTEINTYKLANGRTVGFVATFESVTPYAFSPLKTITKDISNPNNNVVEIDIETDEPEALIYPRITIQHSNTAVVDIAEPITELEMTPNTVYYCENINTYYWLETVVDKETNEIHYNATSSTAKPTGTMLNYTSIVIKHKELDTEITIANNKPNGIVVLDGANRLAYDKSHATRILGDDFSWNWLGLQEGKNTLSFVGNGIVTLEYREPIKCGEA
jgi:hypothetical protein